MKKFLSKTLVAATVVTSVFSASLPMACAAETHEAPVPVITLNGKSANIRGKYINGKPYFSVSDYWVSVQGYELEDIKWYEEEKVLSNGSIFLSVEDQNWFRRADKTNRFSKPVILSDGIVWAPSSFVKDTHTGNINDITVKTHGNTLEFRKTFWSFPNDTSCAYRLPVITIDSKTGHPNFSSVPLLKEKGFSEKNFHILTQALEDNKTVFAYISKTQPQNFLLVTVIDGSVSEVLDNNGIFTHQDYGLRNSE